MIPFPLGLVLLTVMTTFSTLSLHCCLKQDLEMDRELIRLYGGYHDPIWHCRTKLVLTSTSGTSIISLSYTRAKYRFTIPIYYIRPLSLPSMKRADVLVFCCYLQTSFAPQWKPIQHPFKGLFLFPHCLTDTFSLSGALSVVRTLDLCVLRQTDEETLHTTKVSCVCISVCGSERGCCHPMLCVLIPGGSVCLRQGWGTLQRTHKCVLLMVDEELEVQQLFELACWSPFYRGFQSKSKLTSMRTL